MRSNWSSIAGQVWQRKKEWLLGIIGLALSIPFITDGPPWLIILICVITLLWVGHIIRSGIREVIEEEQEKPVPLMVIVGRNQDGHRAMKRDVERMMSKTSYSAPHYKETWQIDYQDTEIYHQSRLPLDDLSAWQGLVYTFGKKIEYLDYRLPNRTVIHLFLNCPAILALGLGARSNLHHEVIIYHYQRAVAESPYIAVLDLSLSTIKQFSSRGLRILKQTPDKPYQFIYVTTSDLSILRDKEVLVQVYLAGHDPSGDVKRMAQQKNLPLVEINKSDKVLPMQDPNWRRATQEVASVLLELASQVKRIHLCWSGPVPLAFAVGMALGTQSPITLYQWNPADTSYHPVLNLETLKEDHVS